MTAPELTADLSALLLRDLEGFQREIDRFPDEASVWETRPGVVNSAGNLTLHVSGNLRHFIGSILGGIPYQRDREGEFTRRASRDEVRAEIAAAIAVVREVLPKLTDDDLDAPFPHTPTGTPVSTRRFLIHLCTHAAFHVGQAGYLRRIVTGDNVSTDTVTSTRLA
jgi:uncharacterized damage-inducible protein DinB